MTPFLVFTEPRSYEYMLHKMLYVLHTNFKHLDDKFSEVVSFSAIDLNISLEVLSQLDWFNTSAKNNLINYTAPMEYLCDTKKDIAKYRGLFRGFDFESKINPYIKLPNEESTLLLALRSLDPFIPRYSENFSIFNLSGKLSGLLYYILEEFYICAQLKQKMNTEQYKPDEQMYNYKILGEFITNTLGKEKFYHDLTLFEFIYYYTLFSIEEFVEKNVDILTERFQTKENSHYLTQYDDKFIEFKE